MCVSVLGYFYATFILEVEVSCSLMKSYFILTLWSRELVTQIMFDERVLISSFHSIKLLHVYCILFLVKEKLYPLSLLPMHCSFTSYSPQHPRRACGLYNVKGSFCVHNHLLR